MTAYSVAINKPDMINIVTNHGFYFYYYGVDLWNRSQIFPDYKNTLVPVSHRMIRYKFDDFDDDICQNEFGYAFLMTFRSDSGSSTVYLGAVSFYSALNSKLISKVPISEN